MTEKPKLMDNFCFQFFIVVSSKMCSMETAKLLVLACEAMRCVDIAKSKKLIQRAIHVNPLCKEAWIAKNLLWA